MNIREIARQAGVSVATVSRVLNHPDAVAPKTKEKVMSVIREMGYRRNWFARGLNFNKTHTIGLLIPNILDPAYVEIAEGAESVVKKKGYHTLLCITEGEITKEKEYLQTLIDRRVDGVILVSSLLADEDVRELKSHNMPVVLVGENRGNVEGPMVRIDCRDAAYRATNHLLDCGHRSIAFVVGMTPEMENERKKEGYRLALKEAAIPLERDWILHVPSTIEGGYLGGRRFLLSPNPPKAILTSSDLLAFGVMDAVRDAGLAIPDQMAIMGFDNIRMANLMVPKLTTVAKPLQRMGLSGARLLLDVIESRENGDLQGDIKMKEIVLQSKLKIRKSCGHQERIREFF